MQPHTTPNTIRAYCWANGVIEFGATVPEGTLEICRGPAKAVRAKISVAARLAYDNVTLLVPGVPEADTPNQAVDALIGWIDWLATQPAGGIIWSGHADRHAPRHSTRRIPRRPARPSQEGAGHV